MKNVKYIRKFRQDKIDYQKKHDDLVERLIKYPGHSDFVKVAAEMRNYAVKIHNCEVKMKNLKAGNPSNGNQMPLKTGKID